MNNETNPDVAHKNFMKIFFTAYEPTSPEIEKKKKKPFPNQSLTKGIKKIKKRNKIFLKIFYSKEIKQTG